MTLEAMQLWEVRSVEERDGTDLRVRRIPGGYLYEYYDISTDYGRRALELRQAVFVPDKT